MERINKFKMFYYLLGIIVLFSSEGRSVENEGDKCSCEGERRKLSNSCDRAIDPYLSRGIDDPKKIGELKALRGTAQAGDESAIRRLIKACEEGELGLEKNMESASSVAKHFATHGSSEGFKLYMLYHRLLSKPLFTQGNLKLIEQYAIKGNECARGYFVEAFSFGGKGRIEISQSEQMRTQSLIEKFAAEGCRSASESLQYLKLSQLLEGK